MQALLNSLVQICYFLGGLFIATILGKTLQITGEIHRRDYSSSKVRHTSKIVRRDR